MKKKIGMAIGCGILMTGIIAPTTIPVQAATNYTVTFVDGQGKTLKKQTVEQGKNATAPTTPTRTGYTFSGWDKAFTNVSTNLTITAKWEPYTLASDLADGWYTIASNINSQYVLNVAGNSNANNSNISLYKSNGSDAQKFYIKKLNNDTWNITTGTPGQEKIIDLADGKVNGNIRQWQYSNANAQKWKIVKKTDGTYIFFNKATGNVLDTEGNDTITDGKNIWDYKYLSADKGQNFKLTPTSAPASIEGKKTITFSGTTKQVNIKNASVLNNAEAIIYDKQDGNNVKFNFEKVSDRVYKIRSLNSDLYLYDNGSKVLQGNGNTDAYKWKTVINGDGTMSFYNIGTKKYMYASSTNNSTVITSNTANTDVKAKFKIAATDYTQTIANGVYLIKDARSFYLTTEYNNRNNGTKIAGASSFRDATKGMRLFKVTYQGDGYYTFTTGSSQYNSNIDMPNGVNTVGTSPQQYTINGATAQKFRILGTNGNIRIKSGANVFQTTTETDPVKMQAVADNNMQKFTFTKSEGWLMQDTYKYYINADGTKPRMAIDVSAWQGDIDWAKVKATNRVDFVILRVAYGSGTVDAKAERNMTQLEAQGIPYGVYFYSLATDTASLQKELDTVWKTISKHKPTKGIWYDVEDVASYSKAWGSNWQSSGKGKTNLTTMINYFKSQVNSKGYEPGLYCNPNQVTCITPTSYNMKWWVPRYFNNSTTDANFLDFNTIYKGAYLWQYSDQYTLSGINSSRVDVNCVMYNDANFYNGSGYSKVVISTPVTNYSVTFTDGQGKTLKTQTVEKGKAATAPANPTRTGYTFAGWDKAFSNITGATTVNAKWTPNVLTVNYYAGTATGDTNKVWTNTSNKLMRTTKYNYNGTDLAAYGLPNANGGTWNLTQTGYVNTNIWLVGSATTTKTVSADKLFAKNQNFASEVGADISNGNKTVNLYASMTKAKYTVTFKDGSTTLKTQTVEYGNSATAPTAPTKSGYTFTGWDKAYNNVSGNITVNAKWTANSTATYKVTFTDGLGKTLKTQDVAKGKAATAPANPTRTGYTFSGWEKAFTNITANLTVNAKWAINKYTVTFVDGAGKTLKTQTVEYGKAATAPATPTKTGLVFNGWDKTYNAITGNTTVTAKWKAATYTVTFTDGQGKNLKSQTVEYSKAATAPANPTRTGYTFIGWDKAYNKITGNTTVNAKWTAKKIEVVFHKNDETDKTYTETFTYDKANQTFGMTLKEKTGAFGTWSKSSHKLLGWNTNAKATTKQYDTYSGVANNWINSNSPKIHVYAIWQKAGWQNENGAMYYYQNGTPLKGWQKMGKGTGRDENETLHWVFFDKKTGRLYTGWHEMGSAEGETTKHWSYFGSNGWLRTGWVKLGKGTSEPDGNSAVHWSYFGDNGWLRTGWVELGKGTTNPDGNTTRHSSYFNGSGWLVTGWFKSNDGYEKLRYADGNGWVYGASSWNVNTWKKIGRIYYMFDNAGRVIGANMPDYNYYNQYEFGFYNACGPTAVLAGANATGTLKSWGSSATQYKEWIKKYYGSYSTTAMFTKTLYDKMQSWGVNVSNYQYNHYSVEEVKKKLTHGQTVIPLMALYTKGDGSPHWTGHFVTIRGWRYNNGKTEFFTNDSYKGINHGWYDVNYDGGTVNGYNVYCKKLYSGPLYYGQRGTFTVGDWVNL